MRWKHFICIGAIVGWLPLQAHARPVSYPDAWTVMIKNDVQQYSFHAHYTLDVNHSLGLRLRYDRDDDVVFTGAQLNRLFKRWNKPDSQANWYGRIAVGHVQDEKPDLLAQDDDLGIFLGTSADWETRRWFISGAVEYWDFGRYGQKQSFHSRLGVAPYIANTGALHTWIMLEGHNRPESNDPMTGTLLLRFFKGPSLLELGIDDNTNPMVNYIHRF